MLLVRATCDIPEQKIKKGDDFHLYIIDFHHHMGREKGHQNTPSGAYEFYALLWFEMQKSSKEIFESDGFLFEPIGVVPTPFVSKIFEAKKSWNRLNHGWLVDRTVVFPYTDDYSKNGFPEVATFHTSNEKIAGWTTRPPNSSRLIGFCRVDPQDAASVSKNAAVEELEYAVETLGLRGLKLHPLAQLFVDEIENDMTSRVVTRAAELEIPVIFDTRNIRTAERIHNLVKTIREMKPSLGKTLKVILAHCGMNPGNSKLYHILRDPNIFGETSSLHGKDIPVLFEMASERLRTGNRFWSDKILFGTDYSFLSVQAVDLIQFLLSHEFPGTLSDAQRILAGNALSLVNRPYRTKSHTIAKPYQFSYPISSKRQAEQSIVEFFLRKDIDLASIDFMSPPVGTWPRIESIENGGYNGIHFDSIIASLRKRDGSMEAHLWIRSNLNRLRLALVQSHGKESLSSLEFSSQQIPLSLYKKLENISTTSTSFEEVMNYIAERFG